MTEFATSGTHTSGNLTRILQELRYGRGFGRAALFWLGKIGNRVCGEYIIPPLPVSRHSG
jgi:hypothetical protein